MQRSSQFSSGLPVTYQLSDFAPPAAGALGVVDLVLVAFLLQPVHPLVDGELVAGERPILARRSSASPPRSSGSRWRRSACRARCRNRTRSPAAGRRRACASGQSRWIASAITWAVEWRRTVQRFGVAVGEDRDGVLAGELGGEIDDHAVDLRRDRGLGQPLADRFGQLVDGAAVGKFLAGTVGENCDCHVVSSSERDRQECLSYPCAVERQTGMSVLPTERTKKKNRRNLPGGCGLYRLAPTRHRPSKHVAVVVVVVVIRSFITGIVSSGRVASNEHSGAVLFQALKVGSFEFPDG